MIYNHGNGVTNELHFGVPMIMASHGYFVVSPNHPDGSANYALDVNGEEVWYNPAEGNEMTKKENGKTVANMGFWDATTRTLDKRIKAVHTLAQDISSADFCKNNLGSDISLDTERMISSGQSFGGITAISAANDDQPYFKAVVTHDPCFFPAFSKIDNKSFNLKHPT